MKLLWSVRAAEDLDGIYDFYKEKSESAANKIYNKILDEAERLIPFPGIAPRELLLYDKIELFRSLVVENHFKIIYYVDDETIHITNVWDCRRNPDRYL